MGPYPNHMEHKSEEDLKALLKDYFHFAHSRYVRMRNALIVFAIIVVVGCFGGILSVNNLSRDRHVEACRVSTEYNSLLRALVNHTSGNTSKLPSSRLLQSDPALYNILIQAQKQSREFKAYAYKKLTEIHCE